MINALYNLHKSGNNQGYIYNHSEMIILLYFIIKESYTARPMICRDRPIFLLLVILRDSLFGYYWSIFEPVNKVMHIHASHVKLGNYRSRLDPQIV